MCKRSFVAAWLALAAVAGAQEYTVGEPNGEVEFNGVTGADESLIFDSSEMVINPDERLELNCGYADTYRQCVWTVNDSEFQVADVEDGVFEGMSRPENTQGNECGIIIQKANTQHHGMWTCKVYVVGKVLQASKNVVVTVKPTNPSLDLDNPSLLEVTSGVETDVKCAVAAARPAVGIRWFLGETDVTVMAQTEETPTDNAGMYRSTSTLRRSFEPSENGQVLMCSVSHQTLAAPANASVPLNVVFKPVEKPVSTFYQIRPGTDYEVRLNFTANPEPLTKEWSYGDSFQNQGVSIPIPGADDRYSTDIESLGNGMYTAILRITGFTEGDSNQRYMLTVSNEYGQTEYKVKLSMGEAPKETLSGGAVAGIIIVVLVIVAAVGAAGYARYRQMFCFAPVVSPDPEDGKEGKEEHDTESARGANAANPSAAANIKNSLGRLTQVFKKNKKEQDTKLEGVEDEKKSLTTDEPKKDSPAKESNVDEKEVVYAELDLSKGEGEKKTELKTEEKTEYAQIVGTVGDNREEEKKE